MEAEAAKFIGAGLAVIALAGVGIGIGNIFCLGILYSQKPCSSRRGFWHWHFRFCLN